MIDRSEILAVATDLSLSPDVVEKDYVLGWLLAGIYAQPSLVENWVFKGGTCLKKCYFETYRFSEDLDFTLIDAAQLTSDILIGTFRDVSAWVYENTGIQIPVDQLRFDTYTNPRGGTSCQGRIYYSGPLPRPGALSRIKLDLTADELLALPAVERSVGHPYSDLPEEGILARCYAYEEIFGEKVRALGERARPRDLYDVVNLFRHGEFRPAAESILDVLRRKCEFKRIPLPSVTGLGGRAQELAADWGNMLGHQLPVLPPFESFWNVLPEFFDWLTGVVPAPAALPTVLASIHAFADEDLYRPAVGVSRRQGVVGSSFIESIRFAGANRLRVDLGYQGSARTIEPYSLRRSRAGDILVYAVKSATGEPRSYRLDRIQSVRTTNEVFLPRYAIELAAGESGFIPSVSAGSLHTSYRAFSHPPSSGPTYIYKCPVCQKEFRHKKQNAHLRPHKSGLGWPCSGRIGYLIDTHW
ncbi:MAG: nucleotidyl transferase AbiEii/AbiGii toxin family protein [Acidobacteriaceae bacterium]